MPETVVGQIILTVDEEGAIQDLSGGLTGTVDESGQITFVLPNAFYLSSGVIRGTILTAESSEPQGEVIVHTRIEARSGAGEAVPSFAGQITQVNPAQALSEMHRVRFVNGQYVAVGDRGAIAFSSDGHNWNRFGVNTTVPLRNVAYGNGNYVVVGDDHVRYHSTDGIEWSALPKPLFAFAIQGVAFGNDTFVQVTVNGEVSRSADGIAWTSVGTPLALPGFPNVDFINNQFVLWRNNQLSYSSDGETWSDPVTHPAGGPTGSGGSPQAVAYGNGRYVVSGGTGAAYSSDGITWTSASTSLVLAGPVAYGDGVFFIYDSNKDMWRSSDGDVWTRVQRFDSVTAIRSIIHEDGLWVALGSHLYTSTDGLAWVLPEGDATRPNIRNFDVTSGTGPTVTFFQTDYSAGPYFGGANVGTIGPLGFRAGNAYVNTMSSGRIWVGDNGLVHYFYSTSLQGPAPALTDRHLRVAVERQGSAIIAGDGGTLIRVTPPTQVNQPPAFELLASVTEADLLSGALRFRNPAVIVLVGQNGTILRSEDRLLGIWFLRGPVRRCEV